MKLLVVMLEVELLLVTPFVGVWIETLEISEEKQRHQVTPFVGVWIETWIVLI